MFGRPLQRCHSWNFIFVKMFSIKRSEMFGSCDGLQPNEKKPKYFWPLVNSTAQSFPEQIRKVNWRKLVLIYVVGVNVDTAAAAVGDVACLLVFLHFSFHAGVSPLPTHHSTESVACLNNLQIFLEWNNRTSVILSLSAASFCTTHLGTTPF